MILILIVGEGFLYTFMAYLLSMTYVNVLGSCTCLFSEEGRTHPTRASPPPSPHPPACTTISCGRFMFPGITHASAIGFSGVFVNDLIIYQ